MSVQDEALAACTHLAINSMGVLEEWVRTNSHSANIAGVNSMGDLLARDFAIDGLVEERHPGDKVGDHLVFKTRAWESASPESRLLLVGHHDTVFPPGSFEGWELTGDIAKGPGVLDMKGGLYTIFLALKALAKVDLLAKVPLAFVCVGDEEIGSPHSADLLRETAKGAGAALVFEAGRANDLIITRRKGTGALKVRAKGKAAHAGNHHKEGRNAIAALATFIVEVQKLTDYERGVTVNVGLVEGGEARNTVPHSAECQIDFRLISLPDGDAVVKSVKELAEKIARETEVTLEVSGGVRRPPLEKIEGAQKLYEEYASAAMASGLGGEEANLIGGGSDASTVSVIGVPAIDGMGPRGKGFHTHQEYIEVSSLPLRAEALIRFLCRWGGLIDA